MAKSFKKVIASLLAVLMVIFAMPLTALANGGDYKLNVSLQFSPVYTAGYFDYSEVKSADSLFDYTMLAEAPLTYDYTVQPDNVTVTGTLKLEAAKTVAVSEAAEADPLEADQTLKVGDYFAVTVVVDGSSRISSAQNYIGYSDNIEPAGTYTRTSGRNKFMGLAGISDAQGSSIETGGLKAVDAMSAAGLTTGVDDGAAGNVSSIDDDNNVMLSFNVCQNGKDCSTDVTVPKGVSLTDPETGALDYDYTAHNRFIANTFIFKIVDEGDISFNLYDPYNTKLKAYSGCYWLDNGSDARNANYNTYANYTTDDQECKGQNQILWYGRNVNSGEGISAECQHTKTSIQNAAEATCGKAGYTGDTICDDCGATVATGKTIPATGKHTYKSEVTKDATCTAAGKTKYTCEVCGDTYTTDEPDATGHKEAAAVHENETDSTCTVAGTYDEVVYCSVCNTELSRETKTKDLADHTPAAAVRENEVAATEDKDGSYDEVVYCSVCNTEISRETKTIPATGHTHTYTSVYTEPTCTENGYTTYTCVKGDDSYVVYDDPATLKGHTPAAAVRENETDSTCTVAGTYDEVIYCSVCNTELSRERKAKELAAHTPAKAVHENETDSTCKVAGTYDEVVYCSVCGDEISRETKTKDLAAHTPAAAVRENETNSTCTVAGKYDEVVYCSVCNTEISRETKTKDLADHTPGEATRENEVAPTKSEDGSYEEVIKCTVCGEELSRTTKTIAATGVNVTIANDFENYGDVTPGYGTKNYKYGSTVKLSATPVEGATFVGWSVNNKIVSTSANYSFTAYVDTTITPVFNDNAAADTITVVFLDMYKNVTAAYENISVADFQAAMATAIPAGTEYPGYTFTGWSMSDDAIKALAESATITANYDVRETEGYTVTAQGAKITVGGKTVDNEATGVAYDSKVTVKADNATAWKIDGVVVAYGDSYTFFVGSNVTVEPVFDTIVNKEASVTIISTGLSGSSDYKVAFLATVNVPEGYTMIDRGFVYGKSATAAELTLDNVGNTIAASGAKVKSLSFGASNASDQYGLTYGIKAKDAPAVAVAYVTVKTADGTIKTVYSDASVYNY